MLYTPNVDGNKLLAHTTNVTRCIYLMFKFLSDFETPH
jgi:hypothetical protein